MKLKLLLLWLALSIGATACRATVRSASTDKLDAAEQTRIAERLKATFKNFQFDELHPSPIPGIVEVYSGPRIIYYAPQQDLLIFGELYSTAGHSLTADELAQRQSKLADTIDISSAVSVGDGPIQVLAFVDPDCGYCKAAHQWLQQQGLTKNITEKVFFMPLTGRPEAHARAESVLCAPPALRQTAYDQLWNPALGHASLLSCDGADEQLAAQAAAASRFGVRGTPTFVVKTQTLTGFQPDRLQTLLSVHP